MLTTTTNEILKHNPCTIGWQNLTDQLDSPDTWVGNNDPITIEQIIESNCLEDAFWALRALKSPDGMLPSDEKLLSLAKSLYLLRIELLDNDCLAVNMACRADYYRWNFEAYYYAIRPIKNRPFEIVEYAFGMAYRIQKNIKSCHVETVELLLTKILTDFVNEE